MEVANLRLPFTFSASDYPDAGSFAVSVYMMGCSNGCAGCFNPEFQDYDNRENTKVMNVPDFVAALRHFCTRSLTNKVVLLGGDPLFEKNVNFVKEFLDHYGHEFDVCVYTGCDVKKAKACGLKGFRFIKTGRFVYHQRQPSIKSGFLMQFASANQELYDSDYNLLSQGGVYSFA